MSFFLFASVQTTSTTVPGVTQYTFCDIKVMPMVWLTIKNELNELNPSLCENVQK